MDAGIRLTETTAALNRSGDEEDWVVVKELKLTYHNSKTIFFSIYPHCGNFKLSYHNSKTTLFAISIYLYTYPYYGNLN